MLKTQPTSFNELQRVHASLLKYDNISNLNPTVAQLKSMPRTTAVIIKIFSCYVILYDIGY